MSTTTGLATWYPVDEIMVHTTCHLHIPLSRVENKTKEVATSVVMPGHVLQNSPIPVEYSKVFV
jgi:hypothetical protein